MKKHIAIMVISHRFSTACPADPVYLPLHVGSGASGEGWQRDDDGANISSRNPTFCELTGLYWAWKNLDADYIGLVHYRRFFGSRRFGAGSLEHVADEALITRHLSEVPLILPAKRHYLIETIYSHYAHTHYGQDLDLTLKILEEISPSYVDTCRKIYARRSAHMFNMLIAKQELFHAYCEWLFPILFEIERRLDITGYTAFERRVFGRISEILLNVWVEHNHIPYHELPLLTIGKPWRMKRMIRFLKAKFFNVKYKSSF